MNASIFAKDFKPRPYWWEHHEPAPLPEIALPADVPVVIVSKQAGIHDAIQYGLHGG